MASARRIATDGDKRPLREKRRWTQIFIRRGASDTHGKLPGSFKTTVPNVFSLYDRLDGGSMQIYVRNWRLRERHMRAARRRRCYRVCVRMLTIGLMLVAGWMPSAFATAQNSPNEAAFLVQFAPAITARERKRILAEMGYRTRAWLAPIHVAQVVAVDSRAATNRDRADMVGAASALARSHPAAIRFVEQDAAVVRGTYMPNDPALHDAGTTYAHTVIDAARAWEYTTGDAAVIIAVLDTGVNPHHVELIDRLAPGYDYVNDDADPADDNGHGTHVAGIIGATMDNGHGGAGLCPHCRIMPIKVLDANNMGYWSGIVAGILHAVDHGAKIINLSLGGPQQSQTVKEAIAYAHANGVLVVAAAGNSHSSDPFYPAAYPHVLAVSATDHTDGLWSLSNTGAHIDVAAPGYMIYSTSWDATAAKDEKHAGYSFMSGTSMAAPHISGLAGLLWSQAPTRRVAQIVTLITTSATDLGEPGWDPVFGHGRINAGGALAQAAPPAATPVATPAPVPPIPAAVEMTEQLFLPIVIRQ